MEHEIWKEIEGYESLYQVSSFGRIRSYHRAVSKGKAAEVILKQNINGRGYCVVNLYKNGTSKRISVHRLVAKAFLLNNQSLPVINHKDFDKKK